MQGNLNPSARVAIAGFIAPQQAGVGTITSDWVDMRAFYSALAVLQAGVIGAGGTVDVKVEQATSNAGAGAKAVGNAGRAGELLGLDAPQRASTGPGNGVVFGDEADGTLSQVEFDQLRGDLASSASQFEEYRVSTGSEIERLKGLLEAGDAAFRDADAAHAAATEGLRVPPSG